MTCKGVYASLGFNIYITKDELMTLLTDGGVHGSVHIGKTLISDAGVEVYLSKGVLTKLQTAWYQDQRAIDQAKASMASGYFKSVNKIGKP